MVKVRILYWIHTVVLVISPCSSPFPSPSLTTSQRSKLLSFLWSSHGIWWLLCRCQVCSCGRSHHPNWPLLPGTCDFLLDWTEDRQSPPRDKDTKTHTGTVVSCYGGSVGDIFYFPLIILSFCLFLRLFLLHLTYPFLQSEMLFFLSPCLCYQLNCETMQEDQKVLINWSRCHSKENSEQA